MSERLSLWTTNVIAGCPPPTAGFRLPSSLARQAIAPKGPKFPLVTRRLYLRPPQLEDCQALSEILPSPPASLAEWLVPTSPQEAEARIRSVEKAMRTGTGLGLVIVAQSSGRLVGWFEFKYFRNQAGVATIGFWLSSDCRGMGFAVEAGRAAIPMGIAFLNMKILWADVGSDNVAAIRVLQRLGLKPVGKGAASKTTRKTISFCKDLAGIA